VTETPTSLRNLIPSTQAGKKQCDIYGSVYSIFITLWQMYNYSVRDGMIALGTQRVAQR
jgi:hypothetical protein